MDNDSKQKPNLLRRIAASKYLRRDSSPTSVREIIYWWELRRVPFNLAVGIAGLITCAIWLVCLIILTTARPEIANYPDSPLVPDGGVFAIVGIILYAIAANVCYTGGWIVEVVLFWLGKKGDMHFGPVAFALGTALSLLLTLLPAVVFVGYTVVRVFGE